MSIDLLLSLTEKINRGKTLYEVLDYIFDSFNSVIPYDRMCYAVVNKKDFTTKAIWNRSHLSEIALSDGYEEELTKNSSLRNIIKTEKTRIINDLEEYYKEHNNSQSTSLVLQEGIYSSLTCPLYVNGVIIGFLFFSSSKRNTYKELHISTFQGIANNISGVIEKTRILEELRKLNNLKDRFLGVVVHDLRSPVSVIKGYTSLFEDGFLGELSDSQKEAIKAIDRSCDLAFALIDDLLDVSTFESVKIKLNISSFDLVALVKSIYEDNNILSKAKSIELKLESSENIILVNADLNRVRQILNNLISNAIKFSSSGKEIKVVISKKDEKIVEISVIDNAGGISEDEISKLFVPFKTGSIRPTAGEKSTGLGLYIVKKLVESHGGTMNVESKVGIGSRFYFTIPL